MSKSLVTKLAAAGLVLGGLAVVGYLVALSMMRPYDRPEYAEIDTSESAFLIPLEGDPTKQAVFQSAELLEQKKVAAKRVQITHQWKQTGRWPFQGEWVPAV